MSEFLEIVGGQTEVDELVVLDILGVLVVDLSSLEIIIGVLSITVNTHTKSININRSRPLIKSTMGQRGEERE